MNTLVILCVLIAGASAVPSQFYTGLFGHSGIVRPDGNNVQFTQAEADNIVLVGPSGVVTRDGSNYQLRSKRALSSPFYTGLFGHSGIVSPDGKNVQFTQAQADNIVLVGPSGVVTRDGSNYQLRSKRSTGYVNNKGSIGLSGIVTTDGYIHQFSGDQTHNIVLIGPSGIVTKNGMNMQLDENLRIVNHRSKRHLIGASGMITEDGTPVQFKTAGTTILLEGPSGLILSDGTLVQKRSKRDAVKYGHTFGHSGIITKSGKLIQLEHGVSVVSAGPSGAVLSNGKNVQF